MVCAWGLVVVVGADGSVTCLREKPLAAKLALLHAKSLYLVALNLAQSEQARSSSRNVRCTVGKIGCLSCCTPRASTSLHSTLCGRAENEANTSYLLF